jgi:hypothetical protein
MKLSDLTADTEKLNSKGNGCKDANLLVLFKLNEILLMAYC